MPLTLPYLCGLAATVYVTVCLVCAAVRWFHMCRPYNHNPRYYYPGRPYVTAVWMSSLALLPYVMLPDSADAWFLARLYFLPVTMYHFILILFSYFGSVMQWKKWQGPALVAGVPVVIALGAAVVLAAWPGDQLAGLRVATDVLYILGILITGVCFASIAVVFVWAGRFDPDDYSNPDDFPVKQARRWMVMIIVSVVLCWTGALLDSPAVLAVIMLLIAAVVVTFVLSALHPNRNRPVEEQEAQADEPKLLYQRKISATKQAEILAAVITVVEEQEAFLDAHLTLQDVADRCGYSRTYISGLVKSELGGFVNYVNRLRLSYVEHYMKQNPGATLGEAIDAAGFGSRPAYYAVKGK